VQRARQQVFAARAQRATSTMARGVFTWAANESVAESQDPRPHAIEHGIGLRNPLYCYFVFFCRVR
jgi:hypothetical protein